MIDGTFTPQLAIADREDAGAEEGGDEEVEGGEGEKGVEEGGEMVGEVRKVEEAGEGLRDAAEERREWEGHGGGGHNGRVGDIHGQLYFWGAAGV